MPYILSSTSYTSFFKFFFGGFQVPYFCILAEKMNIFSV